MYSIYKRFSNASGLHIWCWILKMTKAKQSLNKPDNFKARCLRKLLYTWSSKLYHIDWRTLPYTTLYPQIIRKRNLLWIWLVCKMHPTFIPGVALRKKERTSKRDINVPDEISRKKGKDKNRALDRPTW